MRLPTHEPGERDAPFTAASAAFRLPIPRVLMDGDRPLSVRTDRPPSRAGA
jgi:hypothetical protein